jgi:hypothetical protein
MYFDVKMSVTPTLQKAGIESSKYETSKKEQGETHNKLKYQQVKIPPSLTSGTI